MKDKIEIGEYVKVNTGEIFQFGGYYDDGFINAMTEMNAGILYGNQEKCCVAHNKSIIELLNPNDYVNGWRVLSINNPMEIGRPNKKYLILSNCTICEEDEIKSVITKEYFDRCKFIINKKEGK